MSLLADTSGLPWPVLLSQTLVAFTIEFDNEFEHQMPHRTSTGPAAGSRSGPWLASLVMWSNFMQYVREEGVTVRELLSLARTPKLPLDGMRRWGYVVVAPDPSNSRPKPPQSAWVIRPTPNGRMAQTVWRRLFGVMEQRWQARFGQDEIGRLRESLSVLVSQFDVQLPEFLPVLGFGFFVQVPPRKGPTETAKLPLLALLSKVLLAFTIDFESEPDLSLAMCANVVRLLSEEGLRVRDLPQLSGVSKEAIQMAVGYLARGRYAVVEPDPAASRTKLVRLTPKGREAQEAYRRRLGVIEERWRERFGQEAIHNLRASLERVNGGLFRGLEPYPDGWRAKVRKPGTLPHYPLVLHRGGYPDGS